jgi:hypothetical protein
MTVIIERPIKYTNGLAVRARKVGEKRYAIELLRSDGTWWEFPVSAVSTKEDALNAVRSIARSGAET